MPLHLHGIRAGRPAGRRRGAGLLAAAWVLAAAGDATRLGSREAPEGPIALLPLENLSGMAVPMDRIEGSLREAVAARGPTLLEPAVLEGFMARHRVRYTGGLDVETAKALLEETGATSALVTSVTLYLEGEPPAVAMTSRLVSAGAEPRLLWMQDVAMTGDEAPGPLGLGVVHDPAVLLERTASGLAVSLSRALQAAWQESDVRAPKRFRPKRLYRSPSGITAGAPRRLAVLPFQNQSPRRNAGELVALALVRALAGRPEVVVLEPGVVRQTLLQARLIPAGGVSLPQADVLRLLLGADLVVSGEVLDYQDRQGAAAAPVVNFAARILDTARRQVVWSSISYGSGDDGVLFFDLGRVRTAHALADRMALGLVQTMLGEGLDRPPIMPVSTGAAAVSASRGKP